MKKALPLLLAASAFLTACGEGKDAVRICHSEPGVVPVTGINGREFWIDRTEVTVRAFARFVTATGYVTRAERGLDPATSPGLDPAYLVPGSMVFVQPTDTQEGRWTFKAGASWRDALAPGAAGEDSPVVQITLEDARAYAAWAGGRLPSETEWEAAADGLGKVEGEPGAYDPPMDANVWRGAFPAVNGDEDGYRSLAPVGCYPASDKGIVDLLGNAWELTADAVNPARVDDPTADRIIKGGSFLCAPNFCQNYRRDARQPADALLGTSHVSFRLVYDSKPATS